MKTQIWMPRPCAVETHACGYKESRTTLFVNSYLPWITIANGPASDPK
jgi:hypothetical protein